MKILLTPIIISRYQLSLSFLSHPENLSKSIACSHWFYDCLLSIFFWNILLLLSTLLQPKTCNTR